jgi:endoglucanase
VLGIWNFITENKDIDIIDEVPMKLVLFLILAGCLACSMQSNRFMLKTPNGFAIRRGLNASHWLSQTDRRGPEREQYIQARDFRKIAEMGFDHIRLPVDEEQLWDDEGNRQEAAWKLLHQAIRWSFENRLRVIVDLHVLRSHHFNIAASRTLWEDESAQEKFIQFWHQLSAELRQYPDNRLAYEPLNEAVSENPENWNTLINWVISEIRTLEPERTIIMGSNNWQTVGTFKDLKVPPDDKNIMLSFHYYEPMLLTHYRAGWTDIKDLKVPVHYPGLAVDTSQTKALSEEELRLIRRHNHVSNRETLEQDILQAVEVAEKFKLPLYCGEFGCYPTTPVSARQAWYSDMIAIFDKHHIAWAHWNYKNDFPVVDAGTLEPIGDLVSILVKK